MKILFCLFCSLFLMCNSTVAQGNLTSRYVERVSDDHESVSPKKTFRATLGGGYAYRLGKTDKTGMKEVDDLTSKLRHGFNIDTELQYFFQENWGIGLNANYVLQSKTASGSINLPGIGEVANYKESNQFIYVGPSFAMRFENNQWGLHMALGYGAIFYTSKGKVNSYEATFNKTTFGSYVGVAGERRLSRNMGLGLKVSAVVGTVKIDGIEDRVSTSNLMVSAFVSFRTK